MVDPSNKQSQGMYAAAQCLLMVFQVMAVLGAVTQAAYGYVDPGSGLFVFQMVSTMFAGVVFMVRKRLRLFFRRRPDGSDVPRGEGPAAR